MTHGEPRGAVYAFEAIGEDLPLVPLAARRVLDACGQKLSLAGWLSLPLPDRRSIVRAGLEERLTSEGTIDGSAIVGRAVPPPVARAPAVDPDSLTAPEELAKALGAARPLEDAVWRSLRSLDRYALLKCASNAERLASAYDEIVRPPRLAHVTGEGHAHMVDVGAKGVTARRAVATARVCTTRVVVEAIATGGLPKGDVLAVARVAGLMAAKRTPELIPLCHPVQTTRAAVEFEADSARGEIAVRATVEAHDRTGVEMEAMVAASVAALTIYDMVKSADRWASVESVRLESKSGGKSGPVTRLPDRERVMTHAFVALRDEPLSIDEVVAKVRHDGAGAVCVFLGTVRDWSDGRAVVQLHYEAYAPMAIAEMKRIADELSVEIAGVRLALVHRTGALRVGDTAVVCGASAPHRDEAYRACRALIDRIKARVPIWKREHGPGGAYWVGWHDR